jgi:hypothetical protein
MARFNPSYTGMGELLSSPGMVSAMRDRAEKIKTAAEATSPVGPLSDDERTRYRDSWEVEAGVREEPSRRAYATVKNETPYSAAIEFGNGRTSKKTIEAHYVLTRAIDSARE